MEYKDKGITLVALVITIIVLLILAGIVINLTIGNNGIISKAKNAENEMTNAQDKENTILGDFENKVNSATSEENKYNKEEHDNWVIWLYCAGVANPENYDEQVVNNEDIMKQAMNSEEAVNYMINSTSVIMPVVCNSEITVKYIAESTYAGYEVIANANWRNQILNSEHLSEFNKYATTVPVMTSNTTPSGEAIISKYDQGVPAYLCFDGDDKTLTVISRPYTLNGYIGYIFEEEVMPYYVAILNYPLYDNYFSNIKVQGSNDGTTYTDLTKVTTIGRSGWQYVKLLDEASYKEYKYIRILQTTDKGSLYYAGAYTIQFYCRKM